MADYFLRITQCIQYVQAKVEDGDGTPQIQLNRRQCVYLAHELLKLSQFLQDREVHRFGLEEGIRRTLLHLHASVKRAQVLVEGCCCEKTSWLSTAITMGDTKEEFIAILLDLHQWKCVLDIAMCASAGVSETAQLQQLWETGEEGYQSLSKRNSKMQNGIRDATRQDREELLEKIVNLIVEDQRGDDYIRGVYLKAWLNPAEGNLQNVEELKAHSFSGDMGDFLGKGGSGSVLKGKWLGQEVALKIQESIDPTEATVLGKLQHPNIIRLFHYWEQTAADCPRSCIVMELMRRDLQKHIATVMGQRSELPSTTREGQAGSMPFMLPVAIDTMLQVAQAMRELHEKVLMHRDLKTSNILVKPVHEGYLELHSEGYLEVKLADFGSAKTYANTSQTKDLTRNQGTTAYGAPEIFEKEKITRERNFPPKADVWSFGMTCSEILTGATPFAGEYRPTLHARIKKDGLRPNLPEDCPWYLQFCIRSCWELHPQKRPSFSDLCKMLRHAKLMSLGLIDVVDVKCLFWYQTSAGVLKSGVHLLQAQEKAKKSRSIFGAIWYNLRSGEHTDGSLRGRRLSSDGSRDGSKGGTSAGANSQESTKSRGDDAASGPTWRQPKKVKVKLRRKSIKELSDLHTGQKIQGHQGAIWTMKFSPDGRYLASAGQDRVVHVWEVLDHPSFSKLDLSGGQENGSSANGLHLQGDGASAKESTVKASPKGEKEGSTKGAKDGSTEVDKVGSIRGVREGSTRGAKDGSTRGAKSWLQNKLSNLESKGPLPKLFWLSEKPVRSFYDHTEDILDLSWSRSKYLLSASMDKTVRLWDISKEACLRVFSYNDYVTCVQFNPVDDRYFLSGSLDDKFRIWNIVDHQVVDWIDLQEMITAVSYSPDGERAIVGSYKGTCRFYKTTGKKLQFEKSIDVWTENKEGRGKKISGIHCMPGDPQKVLVTTNDSCLRVYDDQELCAKYKGLKLIESQISASYTKNGDYIISASEDSRVLIWSSDNKDPSSAKSLYRRDKQLACEEFNCQWVSVAIAWPEPTSESSTLNTSTTPTGLDWELDLSPHSDDDDNDQFEPSNEFLESARRDQVELLEDEIRDDSIAASPRLHSCASSFTDEGSSTWLEEQLPAFGSPVSSQPGLTRSGSLGSDDSRRAVQDTSPTQDAPPAAAAAPLWGLVIVTAALDGVIRTFQHYGHLRSL